MFTKWLSLVIIINTMKTTNKTILMELKNSLASKENEFVDKLFKERGVKFKKNSNGEYDIEGNFFLGEFPELVYNGKLIIKFGKVNGGFECKGLNSLEGCPREVNGSFYCRGCDGLTDLKGAPEKIKGEFNCALCKNLKSLEGAPTYINGSFICSGCDSLTDLKGAPKEIKWQFYCNDCKNLKSLRGAPEKVGGTFDCSGSGKKFKEEAVEAICDVPVDRIEV